MEYRSAIVVELGCVMFFGAMNYMEMNRLSVY